MRPRVVLVSPSLQTGGLERVVYDLATILPSAGFDVAVVAPEEEPYASRLREAGVPVLPVRRPGLKVSGVARAAVQLNRAISASDGLVIHSHNPSVTLAAGIAHPRTPLLATHHGAPSQVDLNRTVSAYRLSRAVVVGCAESVTAELRDNGVPASRLRTVHNGVRIRVNRSAASVRAEFDCEGIPLIVSVGRLSAEKNQAYFLDLVGEASQQVEIRALVVGGGALEPQLRSHAEGIKPPGVARVVGERADAQDIIAASDLLVITSIREALPIVALEALASGVPVLATRVGGLAEILDPRAGHRFLSGRLSEDAALLVAAIHDLPRSKDTTLHGPFVGACSAEQMVDSYAALYEELARM